MNEFVERYRLKLQPIDPDRFYPAKHLAKRYGIHTISVWRWARNGILPAPVRLGPNTTRWLGRDIIEHERQCAEASNRST